LKLKCDVLRQHIASCNERLDEALKQPLPLEYVDDQNYQTSNVNENAKLNNLFDVFLNLERCYSTRKRTFHCT